MSTVHDKPTPSKVAIHQHPLHPMFVPFPIAFLTGTLASDVVFVLTGAAFWAEASMWLATAGFATGALASLLGLSEFLLLRPVRARLAGWTHMLTAIMALALAGANALLRQDDPAGAVLPWGILLSLVMAGMTGMAGWIGGTLTFGHGIGTYVHEHDEQRHDSPEDRPPD